MNIKKIYKAKVILGIINIKDIDFILFVKSSDNIGKIKDENIYKISEVDLCEIKQLNLDKTVFHEINKIKEGISKLLQTGFYYSFGLDLTNSEQNHHKIFYNLRKNNEINNKK